jgi:WD40 repeat protein
MEFHLWTEGILGGTDSFDQNPQGTFVGGPIKVDANTPSTSIIDVQTWGHTGPGDFPSLFITFLVTVDLSGKIRFETVGHTERSHGVRVDGVNFSPDGSTFAPAGDDKSIRIWDVASARATATRRPLRRIPAYARHQGQMGHALPQSGLTQSNAIIRRRG